MRFSLFLILLLVGFRASAEKDFSSWRKHTQGRLVLENSGWVAGETGTLGLKIDLAKHWHTYWVNPGDSGTPLNLSLASSPTLPPPIVHMPYPERLISGPLVSFAYSDQVLFPMEFKVPENLRPGTKVQIEVDAEWLVCQDVCIPAIDKFKIEVAIVAPQEVKPSESFKDFQRARVRIPRVLPAQIEFHVQSGNPELGPLTVLAGKEFIDFFPFRGSGVSNDKPTLRSSNGADVLVFTKGSAPAVSTERIGVLVFRDSKTKAVEAVQWGSSGWQLTSTSSDSPTAQPQGEASFSIWWLLVSSFLGGLILNLMPCVFPILSLKLLSLLKLAHKDRRSVQLQNLVYSFGVISSFLAVGVTLSVLRSAGTLVGWGFQLQSPLFLAVLVWLFVGLSLNLLGVFEIDLNLGQMGSKWARLNGLWGSFFTGVLAVVVASPCTAPFMGAALGLAVSQPVPIVLGVFFCLGLGLASPYLLFVFVPGWVRFLPKPGQWMDSVKKVLSVPLLLTAIWLLWVLAQLRGVDIVFMVLVGALILSYGFVFAFNRWLRVTLVLTGLCFILLWMLNAPVPVAHAKGANASAESYRAYSKKLMAELAGQNVFVNMTADWCLSCKVNERLMFSDAEVQQLLKDLNVVQVKGDWTERNPEITDFLTAHNRIGVPLYVLFSPSNPQGTVLPEVLTKSHFIELIKHHFSKGGKP